MMPPMKPSAKERSYQVLVDIQEACPITEGIEEDEQIVAAAIENAYRDGFAAALAMLQEPSAEMIEFASRWLVQQYDEQDPDGQTTISDRPKRWMLVRDEGADLLRALADAMREKSNV